MRYLLTTALASSAILSLTLPAIAQPVAPAASGQSSSGTPAADKPIQKTAKKEAAKKAALEQILVTGTLIRGAAPTGSELIGVSSAQIAATGATSADELLAHVPQVVNFFNQLPSVATGENNQLQVNRPNLRDLPVGNTASGSATLVLVDGHRIVGAGVTQDAPDPDVVPPSIIERVEIDPDGGSSTYGADAVGGVINFITKRRFEGVQTDVRYGTADSYNSTDIANTIGHSWGSGSVYVSYDFSYHDDLLGSDRDYVKAIDWKTGIPTGRTCNPGNVAVGSTFFALPGLTQNTFNACDVSKAATIYPQEDRHNLFAGFSQDFGDSVRFDVRTFFAQRLDLANGGIGAASTSVSPTNPFYENLVGTPDAGKTQNVMFNLTPLYGSGFENQKTELSEWGVTPTVTVSLFNDWQVRTMFNYGQSSTTFDAHILNQTLLNEYGAGTTTSTAINPYNIALTPNQQLIRNLANFQDSGEGDSKLLNARSIIDGSLFALPAGRVHAAFGAELIQDSFKSRSGDTVQEGESSLQFHSYERTVGAAFAEVHIPVFSSEFNFPLLQSLVVSASARYDSYSDFGHTYNPRVGVTYKPLDWLTVRGNWSTSFNAPTPVDQLGSLNTSVLAENFFVPAPPGRTVPPGSYLIAVEGSRPNLKPQTAETHSFGIDISPPAVPNLTGSISYYYIAFQGTLGEPPIFNASLFFPSYPSFYTLNPTKAQISALGALAKNGASTVAPFLLAGAPSVFELVDFRETNLGNAKVSGLDMSVRYTHDTDFGTVDANVQANKELKNVSSPGPGVAYVSSLGSAGDSSFRFSATLGTNVGDNFRAQVTWNHLHGYGLIPTTTLPQSRVDSFNLVNLYFRYAFHGAGIYKNAVISLNVDNLFDQDPPVYKQSGGGFLGTSSGYANGQTLGRLFQIGLHEAF